MATLPVRCEYRSGVTTNLFTAARLTGSWDGNGKWSNAWSTVPMTVGRSENGDISFSATIDLDAEEAGKDFSWGVFLDAPGRSDIWGIVTESGGVESPALLRNFTLNAAGNHEIYRLSPCRALGANTYFPGGTGGEAPGIRFSVWAPHAQKVETVIAAAGSGGYIRADGTGVEKVFPMSRNVSGIWSTSPDEAELADFAAWTGKPYMFRVTREDGSVAFRTDLFSRRQTGYGGKDPEHDEWNGQASDLDSTKSCSVVVDPDCAMDPAGSPDSTDGNETCVDAEHFWRHEFNPLNPIPSRLEDMVIYEMHVAGLGAGHEGPGTLEDALGMLDYLADLGVNTVELLPMSSFEGVAGWGYGTAHYCAGKYDHQGRDLFKRFVRACHRRGMAVIVDVVYNHYTPESERVQWMYDSTRHDHNGWYFYQGSQDDYPDFPEGGYCDNLSTGYLPNMREEIVRGLFIGSALALALEDHVDGFRMDLTQALHSFNVLHKDGSPVPEANEAGIRFMREWSRALRLFRPGILLLAEDHSGWDELARSQKNGGVGFDASWWSEWYHQLIGDSSQDDSKARLLHNAGFGTNRPLRMNIFAGMMMASPGRVVYHESHDESGNSEHSARNMQVAVGGMLLDNTRPWAEARCRAVAGMTLLAAGTPMFFMGEEVCAREPYRHDDFLEHREEYKAMREAAGRSMFRFYRDLIRLRLDTPALRSPLVEIIKVHNQNRVLVWRRWLGDEEYLIAASLNNNVLDGYSITHRSLRGKNWAELVNSDNSVYGGSGLLNEGELDAGDAGTLTLRLPASSIVMLSRRN